MDSIFPTCSSIIVDTYNKRNTVTSAITIPGDSSNVRQLLLIQK